MTSWISSPWINRRGDQELVDALVRANADRSLLARLRASGDVQRRDGEYERRHPEATRPFVREVEALAFPQRANGMDTIRPKKRPKGKKRR